MFCVAEQTGLPWALIGNCNGWWMANKLKEIIESGEMVGVLDMHLVSES